MGWRVTPDAILSYEETVQDCLDLHDRPEEHVEQPRDSSLCHRHVYVIACSAVPVVCDHMSDPQESIRPQVESQQDEDSEQVTLLQLFDERASGADGILHRMMTFLMNIVNSRSQLLMDASV